MPATSPPNGTASPTHSLPASAYQCPNIFALERDRIFLPAWHLVCHLQEVREVGDYVTFNLYNERAVVVRGRDGRVRGFHNVCRHRAARLLDGERGHCGRAITCPYHAWTYQLDGRLTGVPYLDDYDALDLAEHSLATVETDVCEGFVFIRFQPGGPALRSYLGPLADDLALYRTAEMTPGHGIDGGERKVNWKNATDNYVDALHIRVAHPGLDALVGDSYQLDVLAQGVHRISADIDSSRGDAASNRAYRSLLPDVDHLPPERQRQWTYWRLWPTLMFDLYPDQVDFMQFLPLTPTSCLLRESAYALPDNRRPMRLARKLNLRINRQVNREDADLINRVQDGMASSSFHTGPLGRSEICLRDFAAQMRAVIPEVDAPD